MRALVILSITAVSAALLSLSGCGDSSGTGYTYGTTSSTGDYATWTITGSDLSVVWQDVSNTGAIERTLDITATCGAADATYSYKTCTIVTASCTDGTASCSGATPPAGETFHILEQPGTALWVHTGSDSGGDSQMHVGFVLDTGSCSTDMSGDYTFVRLDISNDAQDLFGFYRLNSGVTSVVHADFGVDCSGACGGSIVGQSRNFSYNTGTPTESFTSSCSGGVRTINSGGGTLRMMATSGGLFILDMPEGSGGMVSFKMSNAADLSDLAGKQFVGIMFPDNDEIDLFAGTAASSVGGGGDTLSLGTITTASGGTVSSVVLRRLDDAGGQAYSVPAAYTGASNDLNGSYNTLDHFSDAGIYKVSESTGENNVLIALALINTHVVGFGVTYNIRTGEIRNTGNFLFFEKP